MNKRIYFENLDALRFLAFFSVLLFHENPQLSSEHADAGTQFILSVIKPLFSLGHLGVNFFFVLSGFLITYLLLAEEETFGKISIPKFWTRRILRIWPLYFVIVFYGFVAFPLLQNFVAGQPGVESANPIYYLLLIPNFNIIENGYPLCNSLTILWSVGIEEQFYLLWPLLLVVLRKWRLPLFITLVAGGLVFRYFHHAEHMVLRYHTFSSMGDLTIGALMAYLVTQKAITQNSLSLSRRMHVLAHVTGISLIVYLELFTKNGVLETIKNLVFSLYFAFVIFDQCFIKNSLFKIGRLRFLDVWGKYTYGLYCLHVIGILVSHTLMKKLPIGDSPWIVFFVEIPLALLVTMGFSWVSYHLMEKRFLRLRDKLKRISL